MHKLAICFALLALVVNRMQAFCLTNSIITDIEE